MKNDRTYEQEHLLSAPYVYAFVKGVRMNATLIPTPK